MHFNTSPKVPFPGVLDIGLFHSPQMKPCKLADYFTKVRFHIVVNMRQGESNIFQIFNLESIFISKNIFIKKNPTNFSKRVETGVDPCLPNCPLGESPTTSYCQIECWHVLGESRKAGKLLFETQTTAIKLGWDSHSHGIYFISVFS